MTGKGRPEIVDLDKLDRKLLRLLQRNNQMTNLELADQANLSPPTCLRRVRRLRDEKVIIADVSLLDPLRVGRNFFVFIEIVLERQTEAAQQAFEDKVLKADEIMECYMVSGHADFIILVQVSDMDNYHRFVRRTLTDDPNIRNFRSLFAMHRIKFKTEIALEDN